MLRYLTLTKGDIHFQWKYGFYFIYIVLVLLYSVVLTLLPGNIRSIACDIMVYSDPAAMGMFFMGAIVLLEKSQRVLNSIAVSPVTGAEYILGKLTSIGMISLLVGLILLLQVRSPNIVLSCFGILTSSFCFTLCGIIVGTKVDTLTGYIVGTVPFELLGFAPPILYRLGFGTGNPLFLLHPGCAQIELIAGSTSHAFPAMASCIIWIVLLFLIAHRCVCKMMQSVGGVKL